MKHIRFIATALAALFMLGSCGKTDEQPQQNVSEVPADNIYQFKVADGNGDSVSLAQYKAGTAGCEHSHTVRLYARVYRS